MVTREEIGQKAAEAVQVAGHALEQTAKTLAREDIQQAAQEILKVVHAAEDKKSLYTSKTFLTAVAVFVLPLVFPPIAAWKLANPMIWDAILSVVFGGALRTVTAQPVSPLKAPQVSNFVAKFFAK